MKKNKNHSFNQTENDDIIGDEKSGQGGTQPTPAPDGNRTAFFCALVATIISAITFILAFIPLPVTGGVYFMIASALCSLAAAAFLNTQKKHGTFMACKIVRVCAYVLFAAVLLFFIGAAIYTSFK